MKRILSLLAAAGFVFGSVAGASAIDFKAGGTFEMGYMWQNHPEFTNDSMDRFGAATRVNLKFEAIANENLRGVYQARIGTLNWGVNKGNGTGKDSGAGIGTQGVNVKTLDAYLNFRWPGTDLNVRMGLFKMNTPQAVKGKYSDPTVLGERVAGVEATYTFNKNVAVTAAWARTANNGDGVVDNDNRHSKMDVMMLAVPVKTDIINVTPWGMYGMVGENANPSGKYNTTFRPVSPDGDNWAYGKDGKIWWGGLALDVKALDNWIIKADAIYGRYKADKVNRNKLADGGFSANSLYNDGTTSGDPKREGWWFDAQIGYKMDFMTPMLSAWYSTGDDYSDLKNNESGRMPVLSYSSGLTSLGGRNNIAGTQYGARDTMNAQGYTGTWAIMAHIEDIKFIDKLTSAFRVAYIRGTNDDDIVKNWAKSGKNPSPWYLAKNDSAWEFNLDNEYKLYKELGFWVELGYIVLDRNKSNRTSSYENNDVRIFTGFYYSF